MSEVDNDLKNDTGGSERNDRSSDRIDSGVERADRHGDKLSGGRRDRSREMLREELERSFDDAKRADGRPSWKPKDRGAEIAKEATTKPRAGDGATAAAGAEQPGTAGFDTSQPPASWSAEAKAVWKDTPQAVRVASHKREVDGVRGVEAIKAKYADIDQALAPHMPAIRAHGHDAPRAISQLFAWHEAINKNPVQTFDALARAHGHDLQALAQAARGGAQQQSGQQQEVQLDPVTKQLLPIFQHHNQQIGQLQNQLVSFQEAKTEEALANWVNSKPHPHYQQVRGRMAQLIQHGIVPLKDGRVDLDGSYELACWEIPEIRQQLLDERDRAQRETATQRAQRARHASSSLAPSAPSGAIAASKPKTRGKSVRDSIYEALDEARS